MKADAPAPPGRRYAAHISLRAIGAAGQARIRASTVVLLGLGGLGTVTAQYLVGSGVGELLICDFDTIAESNLARQLLYTRQHIGLYKSDVAEQLLSRSNPDVRVSAHRVRADPENLGRLLSGADLVIDASDNYGTRLAVNSACLDVGLPWVMGACIRMEGQLMLFHPGQADSPCYRCVYQKAPETLEDCPGAGIFAPVAGMIGSAMAHLALSRLAGLDLPSCLHVLDAQAMNWRQLKVSPDPNCRDCSRCS